MPRSWIFFGALLNGACLCPLDLRTEERVDDLLERLSLEAVTVLHATPTVYRYLLQQKKCRHDLSKVRLVVLGGEEARATDFELFKKHFAPPALFVNGLGPSESTLALQYFADHQTRLPGNVVPLGSPVADTEVRLLDEAGQPAGICGEIGIRSAYGDPRVLERPGVDPSSVAARPRRRGSADVSQRRSGAAVAGWTAGVCGTHRRTGEAGVATGSSRARSKRRWGCIRAWTARWWWRARTCRAMRGWWPTW